MRMSWKQRYGFGGEEWASVELRARGYEVKVISDWCDQYDLIINGVLPVEVKRSRSYMRHIRPGYYRPTWCFDVARIPQDQDFLLLLIAEDDYGQFWPHLVPSFHAFGRHSIAITSHPRIYKGHWSAALKRWSVIDWLINIRERLNQPLLFMGTGDSLSKSPNGDKLLAIQADRKTCPHFPIGVTL